VRRLPASAGSFPTIPRLKAAHRESLRPEALELPLCRCAAVPLCRVARDVLTTASDRALEPEAPSRERPFIPEIVGNDFRDVPGRE
jgi:hypothetical protein